MDLEALLVLLDARFLSVAVAEAGPVIRGGGVDDELRQALREHKAALVRLHRPRATAAGEWRKKLDQAPAWRRALWAELAAELEAQGLHPRAAEYAAWEDVREPVHELPEAHSVGHHGHGAPHAVRPGAGARGGGRRAWWAGQGGGGVRPPRGHVFDGSGAPEGVT